MLHSNTADEKTKKFIQQTLNFESNMYKLSFKHCCICHQRRLNMKTSNGICYRCQNKKMKCSTHMKINYYPHGKQRMTL